MDDLYALQLSSEWFSVLNRYLVHMRNAAQRWFKLHNEGTSPHKRAHHAMTSDGTRVFVLGGYSKDARADEISLIHVFDTSMYVRFVNLSGQPSKLSTQRISSTRKTMSEMVQRSTMQSPQHLILLLKRLQGWRSNGSRRYRLVCKLSGTSALHGWLTSSH
jgi:hypothetical protein